MTGKWVCRCVGRCVIDVEADSEEEAVEKAEEDMMLGCGDEGECVCEPEEE